MKSEESINYWQKELQISDITIQKYVGLTSKNLDLLKDYPRIGQDVTNLYKFSQTIYRIDEKKK
ncbi:hypothetical protein [uncultured Lactobacillus sp.]|uniref:hypothetical protein n=1 Tax=uncultured Lactobacillus sp. TaxID=153152 RepID=UPI00262E0B4F|nr:hypothetical protein [uncultured Lactobacillus sp.]